MAGAGSRSAWVYVAAMGMLAASLWIGWADFDPNVPQAVVRETIRATPRIAVQWLVQFIAPLGLLVFLAREAYARATHDRQGR